MQLKCLSISTVTTITKITKRMSVTVIVVAAISSVQQTANTERLRHAYWIGMTSKLDLKNLTSNVGIPLDHGWDLLFHFHCFALCSVASVYLLGACEISVASNRLLTLKIPFKDALKLLNKSLNYFIMPQRICIGYLNCKVKVHSNNSLVNNRLINTPPETEKK